MIVHPIGMMRANAAAGGDPVIVQIGDELDTAKRALYDATDWTTMFTGTGGTGAVTADGDQIKYITDLSGGGHHLVAQDGTYAIARAGYIDWNGADFQISNHLTFDAAEQHNIIIVFDPQADTAWIAMGSKSSSGIYAGYSKPGDTAVTGGGMGTNVKYSINNETDLTSPNNGALAAAIAAKSGYRSMTLKNIKMPSLSPLMISYQIKSADYDFTGRVKYIVHAFNPTPTQLSNIHTIWTTA